MPSPTATLQPQPRWMPLCISALAALALYAVTLGGTYVYDDVKIVQEDPRVKSPHRWSQFWTSDYFNGYTIDNLYRPLISQSYGLQWWLHGDKPWAFHLVNILLHATAAGLVAELARRLAGWKVALMAGLLFAVHPVHVEAVAGIVGRADSACTAAMLGGLILFLHRPMTVPRAIAIGVLSIVAMLCKEQGLLMPAMLLSLAPYRRFGDGGTFAAGSTAVPVASPSLQTLEYSTQKDVSPERTAMLWLTIIVAWSVSGMIVLREQILKLKFEWDRSFLDWTIQPLVHSHGADRLLLPVALLGRYSRLLLWPSRLSIDYGAAVIQSHVSFIDPYFILGIVAFIAWLALIGFSVVRKRWAMFFCLMATALTYSMASNVVVIGTIFGERLIYLPSAFILILGAMAIARLPRRVASIVMMAAIALACVRTVTYAARWNDKDQFYLTSLKEQPGSIRLHMLVAERAHRRSDLDTARKIMADAISIAPDYWDSWFYAGIIEGESGRWIVAEPYFKRAFDLQPSRATADMLGQAITRAAQEREASTQPTSAPSH